MTTETWRTLVIMVVGSAVTTIFNMWLFRWKKREDIPQEFELFKGIAERRLGEAEQVSKDLALANLEMRRDMIAVRGQIKYIQGILNGKHWKRQED